MARISAVLAALWRVMAREQSKSSSLAGNNLILVFVLLQQAGLFVGLMVVLVLLVPLSSSPAARIPADRRLLWPFSGREWTMVRLLALLLTPVTWIAGLLWWVAGAKGALQLGAAAVATQFVPSLWRGRADPRRWIPAVPGAFGTLVRKELREMLTSFDTWVAALFAAGVAVYLALNPVEPEMRRMCAMLVVILCSTWTQCLFGRDARSGFTRHRLLPVRGGRILLSKHAAVLVVVALLTAAIHLPSGLAAAAVCLAFGNHRSVFHPAPQDPWTFARGSLFPLGALQLAGCWTVVNMAPADPRWYAGAVALWALSILVYGWLWDQDWIA